MSHISTTTPPRPHGQEQITLVCSTNQQEGEGDYILQDIEVANVDGQVVTMYATMQKSTPITYTNINLTIPKLAYHDYPDSTASGRQRIASMAGINSLSNSNSSSGQIHIKAGMFKIVSPGKA